MNTNTRRAIGPIIGILLAIIVTIANLARHEPLPEALTVGLLTGLLVGALATILITPGRRTIPRPVALLIIAATLAACITLYILVASPK